MRGSTAYYVAFGLMLLGLAAPSALALNDAQVREMERVCEARRAEELEPIRERKIQSCIEQRIRQPDHCRRYYSTYGNPSRVPSGAISAGYFYDLPECREWLEAREKLTASRSRS